MQARDVMTESLIDCSPEVTVAKAAKLMRSRKTGDVLVTDEGEIVGILTDRDIAVRVTAKSLDPDQVLVRDVMSTRVLTGEPSWDLDKIAKTMGKHQIRRLPITENGVPVGMVSLSDIALHNDHKSHVAKSLREISESHGTHRVHSMERNLLRVTVGLGLLTAAAVALSLLPKYGDKLLDQVQDSQIGDRLLDAVQSGREKIAAAVSNS
jgi:Predicted signal-transduction protein containing cAMP-binding and CBS domains